MTEAEMYRLMLTHVEKERDALRPLGAVLLQYFNMEASEDDVYRTFCAWRTAVSGVKEVGNER